MITKKSDSDEMIVFFHKVQQTLTLQMINAIFGQVKIIKLNN